MNTSEQIDKIAPAFLKAQSEIKPPNKKDSGKKGFGYTYVPLDNILDVALPVLHQNDILVTQSCLPVDETEVRIPLKNIKDGEISESENVSKVLTVVTRLVHSSGQWIEGIMPVYLAKFDPQGSGSANTYARRYGLSSMLGIYPPDEDNDAADHVPVKLGGFEAVGSKDPYLRDVGGIVETPEQQERFKQVKKELSTLRQELGLTAVQCEIICNGSTRGKSREQMEEMLTRLVSFKERKECGALTTEDEMILTMEVLQK